MRNGWKPPTKVTIKMGEPAATELEALRSRKKLYALLAPECAADLSPLQAVNSRKLKILEAQAAAQ